MNPYLSAPFLIVLAFICVVVLPGGGALGQNEGGDATLSVPEQKAKGTDTGLPVPRFVSISADKARARTGPGLKYPIEWMYQRDGLPVQVVREFDNWRKVLDIDGQGGWIHVSLLSGERTAIINTPNPVALRESPDSESRGVAALQPDLVVEIERCLDRWCRVRRADFSGWVERNSLWGIYEGEEIN